MTRTFILSFALTCWCFLQTSSFVSAQTNTFPASGNVGIGTLGAPWKLTVVTTTTGDGLLFATTSSPYNPHNLMLSTNLTPGGWNSLVQSGDHLILSQGTGVDAPDAGGIVFGTWSGTGVGMRIAPNGNVGIGVGLPQDRLAVNGGITAKKVTVTLVGWPDYVFQPDYALRPLAEVGRYIREHHHLPDLPSAGEIQQKGLNLGDDQALLLRKIEELTLYLLEQDKKLKEKDEQIGRLDAQMRLLDAQAKRIDQLEERLAELEKGK
jgi:hypothetical protein